MYLHKDKSHNMIYERMERHSLFFGLQFLFMPTNLQILVCLRKFCLKTKFCVLMLHVQRNSKTLLFYFFQILQSEIFVKIIHIRPMVTYSTYTCTCAHKILIINIIYTWHTIKTTTL